jgi:hypothetical protein
LEHHERQRAEEQRGVDGGPGAAAVGTGHDEREDRDEQNVVESLDELQRRHWRGCYRPDPSFRRARIASRPSGVFSGTAACGGGTMIACSPAGS